MTNRVGILGGTFDPVHIGHLITTQYVLEKRSLDKIIFIPCHISPLKKDILNSLPGHRLKMLKLAVGNNPRFEISEFELQKGEVSYTYDSLVEMKKKYADIELIIGYDNLVVFDKWYRPDDIFDLAKVIVMKRFGDEGKIANHKYFEKAIILDSPSIEISSTEIRQRVKNNLPIDYLVPQQVKEYILGNGLYK